MPNLTVIGAQWGDEGKGKVVDYLARTADVVARFQGGPNAGHTVCVDRTTFTFHQIPSAVLNPKTTCVIGCGCVVDPYVFEHELSILRKKKVPLGQRLVIDARAQMILPYHQVLDRHQDIALRERTPVFDPVADGNPLPHKQRIGTTGRGIGPTYADKATRTGIRAQDLLVEETFNNKLKHNLAAANFLLMERYQAEPIPFKTTAHSYWQATRRIAKMVGDASLVLEDALRQGRRVLFEGAQGMHLDLDLGTYPYVTSSCTWAGGVAPGAGISPLWLEEVVGVAKAYTTRVGLGPFPTEMPDAWAKQVRELGHEYGATTGRPRRCGWFDAPVVRASVRHNRLRALVVTKLDVLDSLEELKVCHSYLWQGQTVNELGPFHAGEMEPAYEALPGWREKTS
ncbi:adenylosuccinate synthase, partial [candidate division WOR-3 bacterium]|nr:adenylosuccinate synthase [candidate division WOR-3 bacterium]